MGLSNQSRGRWGEDLAARHYLNTGYEILDRNWRGPEGEIDLVVARGNDLVFCEVKARATLAFGSPAEAVGKTKQRRIRATAMAWLRAHRCTRGQLRFDVASIVGRDLELIEAAF